MGLKDGWKLAILLLIWAAVFYPVMPPLVDAWFNHSDNSHALLVPFVSAYFAWKKREQLAGVQHTGSFWGWAFLAASLALYLVSYAGGIVFPTRLMLVFSLAALVWCCLGWPTVRISAFSLLFLVFMVPVPDTILGMVSFPLQLMATRISADLIGLFSIPVYREGNMLYFLQTQLEVAEACSGIRSMVALTMLAVIFAHISGGGWWRKAVLLLSAIPIALIANLVRISGTGILAHFFGARVARGFLHEFSGVAVFVFGMVLLLLVSNLLKRTGSRNNGLIC